MIFYGMEVMVKERKKYTSLSTGDFKKITLWPECQFWRRERNKRPVRLFPLQWLWQVYVLLQRHRHTECCLGHCRHTSHTNWRLPQLHQQKLIPESLCETALPGDVMQPGKHPMVMLISASYCSLPVGVFYNHTSTRLLSWFLLEICWGIQALLP